VKGGRKGREGYKRGVAPWAQEGDAPGRGVVSILQGGMEGPDLA